MNTNNTGSGGLLERISANLGGSRKKVDLSSCTGLGDKVGFILSLSDKKASSSEGDKKDAIAEIKLATATNLLKSIPGTYRLIDMILETGNINTKDHTGKTALVYACHYGRSEIVRYLSEYPGILDLSVGGNKAEWWAMNGSGSNLDKDLILDYLKKISKPNREYI